ncbi:MAG: NAD(P)-dependent dehydrogenase (short-subunit alcohol dehydrogenase family), partial [Candidatus Latescibacterota bacterium]
VSVWDRRTWRALPQPHRFDVLDITSSEDVKKWARSVIETNGAPDLVINNASKRQEVCTVTWCQV